jgi:serine protease Do
MRDGVFVEYPRMQDELAAIGDALRQVTVEIRTGSRAHGSGVIWSDDGLVVTNAHVVQGGEPEVLLADGRALAGRIVRRDPGRDLAALQIGAGGLTPAVPAEPRQLKAGALVLAMGHPLGVRGALALGVLHTAASHGGTRSRWVRADLRLAPGNSGGPLADARGHVIGINTMIVNGLAYAVPSDAVTRFLGDEHAQAALGALLRPAPLRSGGVGYVMLQVLPDGAAAEARLAVGDVLTAIGGLPFADPGALPAILDEARPGDRLRLQFVRGFERLEREVVMRPATGKPRAA